MTFSIMTLSITIKKRDTQHNDIQFSARVSLCSVVMLNVANNRFMLSVIMVNVVLLCIVMLGYALKAADLN
jgi:hypothetical protein